MDARLTRARDEGLGLAQRTALAAKWRGDILISIHANSAANRAAAGIETYVMAGPGFASTSGNTSDPRLFAGNRNDARNSVLALCVQRNLLAATGAEDRGIRRARFDVLREAPCPAVLVECGFLSNPGESVRLASAAYREQLARAISEGIWDYCRLGRREIVPAAVRPRPESPSL
jgi:N-acetylmuramoyl-L-alanine amidase